MSDTIQAQYLDGSHVGRIVQFTVGDTVRFPNGSPAVPIGGELAGIEHFRGGVRIAIRGLSGQAANSSMGGFDLQPTDKITVDAFEVVASR